MFKRKERNDERDKGTSNGSCGGWPQKNVMGRGGWKK